MELSQADSKRMYELADDFVTSALHPTWELGPSLLSAEERRDVKFLLKLPEHDILRRFQTAVTADPEDFADIRDRLAQLLKTWDIFTSFAKIYQQAADKDSVDVQSHRDICVLYLVISSRSSAGKLPYIERLRRGKRRGWLTPVDEWALFSNELSDDIRTWENENKPVQEPGETKTQYIRRQVEFLKTKEDLWRKYKEESKRKLEDTSAKREVKKYGENFRLLMEDVTRKDGKESEADKKREQDWDRCLTNWIRLEGDDAPNLKVSEG